MSNQNSDIIEVRLSDSGHSIYFKQKARVKDKKEMRDLNEALQNKGMKLLNPFDWFE